MNKYEINFDVFSNETVTEKQVQTADYFSANKAQIIQNAKTYLKTHFDLNRNYTVNSIYVYREQPKNKKRKFAVLFEMDTNIENDFPCVVFENETPVNCGYDRYLI